MQGDSLYPPCHFRRFFSTSFLLLLLLLLLFSFHFFLIQIENNPLTIELKRIVFLNYTAFYLEICFAQVTNLMTIFLPLIFCINMHSAHAQHTHTHTYRKTKKKYSTSEGIKLLLQIHGWVRYNASSSSPTHNNDLPSPFSNLIPALYTNIYVCLLQYICAVLANRRIICNGVSCSVVN